MKTIKIRAKMKSDFVYFVETIEEDKLNQNIKKGRLLRTEFWKLLEEKTRIYDRIALILENEEILTLAK